VSAIFNFTDQAVLEFKKRSQASHVCKTSIRQNSLVSPEESGRSTPMQPMERGRIAQCVAKSCSYASALTDLECDAPLRSNLEKTAKVHILTQLHLLELKT